jgi:hypothetical protein
MHPQPGGQIGGREPHQRSHHRYTGIHPTFRTRWFYSLLRDLPGDRAVLPPSPDGYGWSAPGWADFASARLDTSVEVSGPHDFTVRSIRLRQRLRRAECSSSARPLTAHGSFANPPCHHVARKHRRVHRIPFRVIDVAQRPSVGRDDRDIGQFAISEKQNIFAGTA